MYESKRVISVELPDSSGVLEAAAAAAAARYRVTCIGIVGGGERLRPSARPPGHSTVQQDR